MKVVNNMDVVFMVQKANRINKMLLDNNCDYRIGIRRDYINKVYDIYIVILKNKGFEDELLHMYYFSGNIKEICIELDNIHYFLDITLNRKGA